MTLCFKFYTGALLTEVVLGGMSFTELFLFSVISRRRATIQGLPPRSLLLWILLSENAHVCIRTPRLEFSGKTGGIRHSVPMQLY